MSVLQNDVHSTSRYIKILMDSGASASIIHNSFVRTNKFMVISIWLSYEHKSKAVDSIL